MSETESFTDVDEGMVEPRSGVNLRSQVAILLALATLPVGVLAVAQGLAAYRETQTLRLDTVARNAIEASREERGAILEAFGSISALDGQIDTSAPRGYCNPVLQGFVDRSGQVDRSGKVNRSISFAGVFDQEGKLHCGYPFAADLDISDTPEFKRFVENPRRVVTAYAMGEVSGVPVLVVSSPIWRNGEVVGSLAVSLPSKYLERVANEGSGYQSADFAILGREGVKVAHSGASDDAWRSPTMADLLTLLTSEKPQLLKTTEGEWRVFSATPLFEHDVYAVASWPQDVLKRRPTLVRIATLILPILMWATAVAVAYYAVDRFALRHVLYLDRLVTAYGRTRRKLRAKGVRAAPREFAQLGASFDDMAIEIESRENEMRRSLDEKNVLLKEVYHRVKNNLQLIVSLVSMQLRDAEHEREREGLTRLQERVHGLAMVHQRLYEAEGLDAVRIDTLIHDIAVNAKGSRGPEAATIEIKFDMIEWEEPPERAMPLSLFATEAIGNAFKHSLEFGGSGRGWLRIGLWRNDESLNLEIENFRDPAAEPVASVKGGLGSQLMDGFVRQLRGTLVREEEKDRYSLCLTLPANAPQGQTPWQAEMSAKKNQQQA